LEIGTPLQNFREKLILDAELVLWEQDEEKIAEYHELSTHLNKKAKYFCQSFTHNTNPVIAIQMKR